jgi:thymidylate synthase
MQFHVAGGRRLSCSLYQRSGDVGLGVPFNIASYSFLTHMLAAHCGLEADEFVYFLGNAHIYEPHLQPLMEQSVLKPKPFPRIRFIKIHNDIEKYTLDDIEFLQKYEYETGAIQGKMEMVA